MPSAIRYITKDSPAPLRALIESNANAADAADTRATVAKGVVRGRRYSSACASQPGAIRAADLVLGAEMACLAITDDERDTLKIVARGNPWHLRTLALITGTEEQACQPLSTILREHYQLTTDHHLNVSGLSRAGHTLDTQGFIAHNDRVIVLSYRCSTTISDWLTNLTTTSSAWEIEYDVAQGHSGYFSACLDFVCCSGTGAAPGKPRVHTGFYNNFLVTVPAIRQYIDPLLAPDQPARTLYVVGHSLGAGIATMAACYFLTDPARYDWRHGPHKLRVVTAGSPRACCQSMQVTIDAVLRELRDTDKVVLAHVVRDRDFVPTVPPELFGFRHLTERLVYLTKEDDHGVGSVLINPDLRQVVSKKALALLLVQHPDLLPPTAPFAAKIPLAAAVSADGDSDDDEATPHAAGLMDEALPHLPTDDDDDRSPSSRGHSEGNRGATDNDADAAAAAAAALAKYTKRMQQIPRPFRDHMPDFYLQPLRQLRQRELAEQNVTDWPDDTHGASKSHDGSSSGPGYVALHSLESSTNSSAEEVATAPAAAAAKSQQQQQRPNRIARLFRPRKTRNQLDT